MSGLVAVVCEPGALGQVAGTSENSHALFILSCIGIQALVSVGQSLCLRSLAARWHS